MEPKTSLNLPPKLDKILTKEASTNLDPGQNLSTYPSQLFLELNGYIVGYFISWNYCYFNPKFNRI